MNYYLLKTVKYINVVAITTIVNKMTTILNSGIEKILKIFYYEKKKLHVRALSRKTGLYGQSIIRYLRKLEKEDFLKSEKDGNMKKYSLRNKKQVYSILTLFDIERYDELPTIRKTAIKHYLESLPEKPVYAILFGSTAKNNYEEESDIDILLVTNNKINSEEAEKEADALTTKKISTFQITYKEFKKELKLKEDKVIQSAINTGYPITNHISFYEELNDERI